MIKPFKIGQKIRFTRDTKARTLPSLGARSILVDDNAKGEVVDYNEKGTQEKMSDDFVGIELLSGDEEVGDTVWVNAADFSKLKVLGY